MAEVGELWSHVAETLRPPKIEPLSRWLEANVRLPVGLSAEGGPLHLWATRHRRRSPIPRY